MERCLARNNEKLSLSIQEERIDHILIAKCPGIQVDRNLNWKGHVKALLSKISRAIGFSIQTKKCLTHDTLKTLYTGIAEPHFRCCCSVWGIWSAIEEKHFQKLQIEQQ